MANNTLDKAIEAIPYFGKRIKLFTKKNGNGTCCYLFKCFFIASCALTISLFCLSPLTFDLKE